MVLRGPGAAKSDDAQKSANPPPAPRIVFSAGRVIAIRTTEPVTLMPMLLSYKLSLPTPPQTIIAGAMPILPDAWF